MSLDVTLTKPRVDQSRFDAAVGLLRANGLDDIADEVWARHASECGPDVVYDANITHNLGKMADAAGIYMQVWRPDECGITTAGQLIQPLESGIQWLRDNKAEAEKHNAANGWGLYQHFLPWLERYLEACRENPDAAVSVSR